MACVTVSRMPHSFTSAPVRGALQVAAMDPTAVHAARLMRSIHSQLSATGITTWLSRMSARVRG